MTRQQLEAGAQRLYYIAWAGFSLFYCAAVVIEMGATAFNSTDVGIMIGLMLLFVIGPLVLMHLVRWVYRGFVPQ